MSSISDFTNSNEYTTILGNITNGASSLKIEGSVISLDNGKISGVSTLLESAKGVASTVTSPLVELTSYSAPATLALDSFYSIGQEFDEMIKDNLAVQTMHIKGSDILCSAFCVVVSFLDCKTRNELYSAILNMQRGLTAVAQMSAAANELARTANASMAAAETVVSAATSIFDKNPINTVFDKQPSGMSVAMAASTIGALGKSVGGIVETFERGINVLNYGRVLKPTNVTCLIWDLAKSVLYSLQGQALSYANEAIDKVISPIEDMIIGWIPSECGTRGYAWRFFQKILDGITREKHWILQLIADMFASGTDFSDKMGNFSKDSLDMLELRAFLDALKMSSHRFGDLAIACGIAPCNDDLITDEGKALADAIKSGVASTAPPGIPNVINSLPVKGTTNLDEISESMASMLGLQGEDVIATEDSLSFTYTVASNAPSKIKELVSLNDLGPDYSVFNNGSEIKVIHTFKRMCGGENK